MSELLEEDKNSDGSNISYDLENKVIDHTLEFIRDKQIHKVGSVQPGQLMGSFESIKYEHSGLCKTDCLLLKMENDMFDVIKQQKILRERKIIARHVTKSIPQLIKFYTDFRILDHIPNFVSELSLKKNSVIFRERDKPMSSENTNIRDFYIIFSGRVGLSKSLKYKDQNKII